ncbi:hypothetical protein T08_13430 [Trichinella sp. T8]|nr:hypothetical protein T08_13430 [Trichinella sp. T8]
MWEHYVGITYNFKLPHIDTAKKSIFHLALLSDMGDIKLFPVTLNNGNNHVLNVRCGRFMNRLDTFYSLN